MTLLSGAVGRLYDFFSIWLRRVIAVGQPISLGFATQLVRPVPLGSSGQSERGAPVWGESDQLQPDCPANFTPLSWQLVRVGQRTLPEQLGFDTTPLASTN